MEIDLFCQKIKEHYESKLPFMVFAHPESNEITAYLFTSKINSRNDNFEQAGAILAPFDFADNAYFLPIDQTTTITTHVDLSSIHPMTEVPLNEDFLEKQAYEALVQKSIKTIQNTPLKKVVTSRKKEIDLPFLDLENVLKRLFSLYASVFTYCWYHPETDIWCGATPEILVKKKDTSFATMALAGTKKPQNGMVVDWGHKEKNEQKYVVDAISKNLEKITSVIKISKTYSHPAGTLVHLRTDIEGVIKKSRSSLKSIVNALHPTPAICGTPKEVAKQFIDNNEGYDREFYTGFVGIIRPESETTSLYVNLRCMRLQPKKATLYVGGGITEDSNPELEFIETQNKMQTMLQVLHPLL
ncbi:isochorismate synthase [Jejudonia soesokkakensis]|uniref:isochorismate synthase n=1 Tax=Jejudonia soesokkakensis TaxID=1323432 RepID=A0ABW2MV96_9FLAO